MYLPVQTVALAFAEAVMFQSKDEIQGSPWLLLRRAGYY